MTDKNKTPMSEESVERQMLPRLRLMGLILLFFSLCAFVYGLTLDPPSAIDTPEEMQLTSGLALLSHDGRLNAYGVAGVFTVIGAGCIIIALKRSKNGR